MWIDFNSDAVDTALLKMQLGMKPQRRMSDDMSDEELERALSTASQRVFGRAELAHA